MLIRLAPFYGHGHGEPRLLSHPTQALPGDHHRQSPRTKPRPLPRHGAAALCRKRSHPRTGGETAGREQSGGVNPSKIPVRFVLARTIAEPERMSSCPISGSTGATNQAGTLFLQNSRRNSSSRQENSRVPISIDAWKLPSRSRQRKRPAQKSVGTRSVPSPQVRVGTPWGRMGDKTRSPLFPSDID